MYDKASLALIPSGYKGGSPNGTLYSVLPANGDGDFDFTRATSATRVNKDGLIESVASGVPRLDYPLIDGVVQDCPALLLEPSRTNLVTYSEELTQWGTSGTPIVTAVNNTLTGQTNAYTLEDDNSSGYERIERYATTTAAAHTLSVFIKKKTSAVSAYSGIQMDVNNKYIIFDSYNGSFNTATGNNYTEISVDDYGSYWRLKATATTSSGSTRVALYGAISVDGTSISASATGSETFYGVQVELGSYATSYIPTSGSSVTRNADECNGAGTSAEFNDSEGVLFAEIAALANDGTVRRIAIPNTGVTGLHRIELSSTDNKVFGVTYVSPSNQAAMSYTLPDVTTFFKIAYKYKANDFALWVNGVEVGVDPSGSVPTGLTKLNFDDGSGGNDFYGKVKQLMVFNEALTDAELIELTTI